MSGQEDESGYRPPIIMTTATDGDGVAAMWDAVTAHREHLETTGGLARRRHARFRYEVASRLTTRLTDVVDDAVAELADDGRSPAAAAAASKIHPTALRPGKINRTVRTLQRVPRLIIAQRFVCAEASWHCPAS